MNKLPASESPRISVGDAVAIPVGEQPVQEVVIGRVVAVTDDGRAIAIYERWNHEVYYADRYFENHQGHFPRVGKWRRIKGRKRWYGRDEDEWEFQPA